MISVKLSTNEGTRTRIVSNDTTIRAFLEEDGIDYSRTSVLLDGVSVNQSLDKPFSQFVAGDHCTIGAFTKTVGA